ncbi:T9SS type A sorting domain-containing protein [bacterium]|nr:T9SS type A sorting domain-containing protein [bacterium]MBU1635194.1 T9SS type A sorting domain-containing protein [bacterium]MBU1872446.1 T9SS type A sorting domain-containing protein [bacterium]
MRKVTFLVLAILMMVSFSFAANVTFKVNMMYQIEQGSFNPASNYVDIAGGFNGWDGASHHLTDADADSIWDITINIPEGDIEFKFRLNGDWGTAEFPGGSNRIYTVCSVDQVYECWYNDASATPVIVFKVDMQDQIDQGSFNPTSDYVDIAGSFNGWDGANHHLSANACNDAIWEIIVSEGIEVNDELQFKFRINSSWDTAEFPGGDNRVYTAVANVQEYSVYWNDFDYNFAVTFEVNMSYQIKTGGLDPASGYVDIAGNFNGWDGVNHHLSDADADSIWDITLDSLMAPGDTLYFKFRINGDWGTSEFPGGGPNREYIVQGGTQTYSVWYNDFDPNFIGSNVQFSINMNAQINAGVFDPSINNSVEVQGTFDSWSGTDLEDANSDGIYDGVISVPVGLMQYKFAYIDTAGTRIVENLTQNRRYTVELSEETIVLETVWFNNIEELTYGEGNVTFRVDMTVLQALGFYDRALGDSLELRGGFNGWGSDIDRTTIDMIRQPGAEIYYLTVPFEGWVGDNVPYKFFLNLHEGANHAGEDFYEYELPASWGGGNRWFTWAGVDGDTLMPIQTFQDYVTEGVIPASDSVLVHLQIDMTDALNYEEDAFDPVNDQLFFVWYDAWGAVLQGTAALNIPSDSAKYEYHDTGADNIWECSFHLTGPAPHAIMYKTRYIHTATGVDVEEAGDPYDYGRYRTQWLKPDASGYLPRVQTLNIVKFSTEGLALEVEPEPFANGLVYTEIVKEEVALPSVMKLEQNYPNPFNPVTQIKFSITRANDVTLTIYNILGQMVTKEVYNNLQIGSYSYVWNSRDMYGNQVASGVYFYELNVGNQFRDIKKMVLMK